VTNSLGALLWLVRPGSIATASATTQSDVRGDFLNRAEGNEETGSQSYVPPDEKDDRALKKAVDLLRGTIADTAFLPNPTATVP
jgi:carboxyl-terminal processing protease